MKQWSKKLLNREISAEQRKLATGGKRATYYQLKDGSVVEVTCTGHPPKDGVQVSSPLG